MARTRFVKSQAEIDAFRLVQATPEFLDIWSLSVNFLSDEDVVAELLPPPLVPAREPRMSVTVSEIGRSNCGGPFNGASINIACRFRDEEGLYCLTMPMSTDTAVTFGRELYAEPQKLADISLDRRGANVHGTVTRHGVTYIELSGRFEDELQQVGRHALGKHFYFRYLPAPDGGGLSDALELICVTYSTTTHELVRGGGTIVFRESRHDPVIDIPVVSIAGAVFSRSETHTTAKVVARVPAAQFLPFAFGKMDDLPA